MKRLTLQEVLDRARLIHGERYGYSSVTFYENERTKLQIQCPIHGMFKQLAREHIRGKGCQKCGNIRTTSYTRLSHDEFIRRALAIHGDRYGYDQVVYVNDNTLVTLFCYSHDGTFEQTPRRLLTGRGCKICKRKTQPMPLVYYLKKFQEKHGNKFHYIIDESVMYRNSDYIDILCPKHGIFRQRISHHYSHGCFQCVHRQSAAEERWLNQLRIPRNRRSCRVYLQNGKWLLPDGYDPETNTIYLFHGDYWHGNPNKYRACQYNSRTKCLFGELLLRTKQYEELFRDSGYSVVSIWEADFNG